MDDEPEYVVDPDAFLDVEKVKVTYIRDVEKQQVYARFMSDPVKWDVKALADYYAMSEERAQAIVYLMHNRYQMIQEKGFEVSIVEDQSDREDKEFVAMVMNGENFVLPGPRVVVKIPATWSALYASHIQDPSKSLGALLEEFYQANPDESSKLSVEDLKKIIDDLTDHEERLQNIRDYEEHIEEFLEELAESGADVTFQEIRVVSDKAQRFEKNYFPRTLHDDEIEQEKQQLLKKIEQQTRGTVERNVQFYHDQFNGNDFKAPAAPGDGKTRWKFAFRDLSKVQELRATQKNKAEPADVPTLIRTRGGKMRVATPIEESSRSWSKKPRYIDQQFTKMFAHLSNKFVKPFENVDGDDHLTQELGKEKQKELRVKAFKEAAEAK
eukprot:gene17451-12477_t